MQGAIDLPPAEMGRLEEIANALAHVPPMQRERVAQQLIAPGYLRQLLDLFRVRLSHVVNRAAMVWLKLAPRPQQLVGMGHPMTVLKSCSKLCMLAVGLGLAFALAAL